jgi:hypothetical protein
MVGFMAEEIPDPMSVMGQAAAGLHETFLTLTRAGFTERQALTIIAITLANAPREDPPPPPV